MFQLASGIFDYEGEMVRWKATNYHNNNANAVVIESINGEPLATLSCNMPHVMLEDDEFCVKTWSENEAISAVCRPLFIDTGKRVQAGYATAEIWKFKR